MDEILRIAANLDGTEGQEDALKKSIEALMLRVAAETWRFAVEGTNDPRNEPPPAEMPEHVGGTILANVLFGGGGCQRT